jgi:hypothetical protein
MSSEAEEHGWWDSPEPYYKLELDEEYTEKLNNQVLRRWGSSGVRPATHISDLLYCLKKAHQQKAHPDWAEEPGKNTILTWALGLIFEDTISEGITQERIAFCYKCDTAFWINGAGQLFVPEHMCAVGEGLIELPEGGEHVFCPLCEDRLLVGTTDYIFEDMVHEVKQTRKSQRKGVEDAPWYIEQLLTYTWLHQELTKSTNTQGRIVVNWLMGRYGESRVNYKPKPPSAALDAFRLTFPQEAIDAWKWEMKRRKDITEAEDIPPALPNYDFECAGCGIGRATACENFIWKVNDEGEEVVMTDEEIKERKSGGQ